MSDQTLGDRASNALGWGIGMAIAHLLVNFESPWTPIVALCGIGAIYGLLSLTQ